METIASDRYKLIVGAGATGLSVARFLEKNNIRYQVYDTRKDESLATPFRELNPNLVFYAGHISNECVLGAEEIVISPGVDRRHEVARVALNHSVPVVGDIELFLREAKAPVVGITGSNGKSTVTTLAGLVLKAAGKQVAVGGNLGTPALDLLDDGVEIYVLELSSFQLESVSNPGLQVAVNLNLSQDHMDRYDSMEEYFAAKQRIFFGAKNVVFNLDDVLTQPPIVDAVTRYGFSRAGVRTGADIHYHFNVDDMTIDREQRPVVEWKNTVLKGAHNAENVMAVLAIVDALSVDAEFLKEVLKTFPGLPHRCEFVCSHREVDYLDDSKATNTGAATAALTGLVGEYHSIILVAGGDGKGADFKAFGETINATVRSLVLIGRDADKIAQYVDEAKVAVKRADSMAEAVRIASECARSGDAVLLAPACASFDMFKNYQDRGDRFQEAVRALAC